MLKRAISVGIETDFLRGHMTGIANYSYHLLNSLLEQNEGLQYLGFSNVNWHPLTLTELRQQFQQKDVGETDATAPSLKARLRLAARTRLSKSPTARALRHQFRRRQFARTVGSVKIDFYHALNFLPMSDPGVPVLPTVYDLSFVRYPEVHPGDRLRRLDRLQGVVNKAPLVHTISEFSRSEISNLYGYPADRIFIAPPAASKIFRPIGPVETRAGISRFDLTLSSYFLVVGTLEPRKNLRTVIHAFGRLSSAERVRTPLAIVGGQGWGALDLPRETQGMIDEGSLRFLGSVTDAELRSLYEGAIALLFPSVYEGFGMPVVEALACGTAVAHSTGTSMDEISGDHATRISALDVLAWTEAMHELRELSSTHNNSVRLARIEQAATFSWQKSATVVSDVYSLLA